MDGFFLLILASYLSGSIPFGKLIGNYLGVDIQKKGSGNIGFANALRTLGWKAALPVLAGDVLKGYIPVYIATGRLPDYQVLLIGLAALLGHIFPIWLKFKGGKGIATGLGVTLALNPLLGFLGIIIYVLSLFFFRKSAPSSLTAAWALPFLCLVIIPKYVWFYLGLAILVTWTHRTNIKQMIKAYGH